MNRSFDGMARALDLAGLVGAHECYCDKQGQAHDPSTFGPCRFRKEAEALGAAKEVEPGFRKSAAFYAINIVNRIVSESPEGLMMMTDRDLESLLATAVLDGMMVGYAKAKMK